MIASTKQFSKHNSKFIDTINITINGPAALWKTNTYGSTIWFSKNDMSVIKRFKSNDFDELINQMNIFMKNEIKV